MDASFYTDDFAQASEYLRLALALLSKHQIPPSPFNFRLGYDAVAGNNETLKTALEEAIERPGGASSENLWDLYRQNFIQDDKTLDAMRQELRRIITSVQGQFEHSGNSLSRYTDTLNHFSEFLDSPTPPEAMTTEVDKVIQETRSTEQLQRQMETQLSSIVAEVTSLRNELEQVRQESLTDALTGISNRKAFDVTLEKTVHQAREQKAPFSMLLADIDHFKQFNDTHGHLVGDKVLRFVATTLKRCLKGKDLVARFGGEEFAVILPQTDLKGAEAVAEQIRQSVSAGSLKDKTNKKSYGRVTISVGMAQFAEDDLPNALVSRADQALYLAKERGRDRIERVA